MKEYNYYKSNYSDKNLKLNWKCRIQLFKLKATNCVLLQESKLLFRTQLHKIKHALFEHSTYIIVHVMYYSQNALQDTFSVNDTLNLVTIYTMNITIY